MKKSARDTSLRNMLYAKFYNSWKFEQIKIKISITYVFINVNFVSLNIIFYQCLRNSSKEVEEILFLM